MPRFKVLAGMHFEQVGGKKYVQGDVFDSPHELDVLFAGKFERLSGKTKKGRDETHTPGNDKNLIPPTVARKRQVAEVEGNEEEIDTDEQPIEDETGEEFQPDAEVDEAVAETEGEAEEAEEPAEETHEAPKAKVKKGEAKPAPKAKKKK